MEIRDFERIRVGQGYPACFDIKPIGSHEVYGIYAKTYTYESTRIELRRKDSEVALFTFKYDDLELPEYWQDSELLWSSRK